MTTRLVLDDYRNLAFPDGQPPTTVRDWRDARDLLAERPWDEVYLDFDLDETMGYGACTKPLAEWLADSPERVRVGRFVLHTANSMGRKLMRRLLEPHWTVADVWLVPQTRQPLVVRGERVTLADGSDPNTPAAYAALMREWIGNGWVRDELDLALWGE